MLRIEYETSNIQCLVEHLIVHGELHHNLTQTDVFIADEMLVSHLVLFGTDEGFGHGWTASDPLASLGDTFTRSLKPGGFALRVWSSYQLNVVLFRFSLPLKTRKHHLGQAYESFVTTTEAVNEWVSEWVNEWVSQWAGEWASVSEGESERGSEWVNESVSDEWVRERRVLKGCRTGMSRLEERENPLKEKRFLDSRGLLRRSLHIQRGISV